MKYKVKNITIIHDGKKYPAGSVIELKDEEAEKLKPYLEKIEEGGKKK